MSSNDHPESGPPETNDKHEAEATTSPQDAQPQPTATEPSSAPASAEPVAENTASTFPSGDAAASNPPASGGDTVVGPMTATTSTTTTTPANENTTTVVQSQPTDLSTMDTEETKPNLEHSSEQSEDVSGKEVEDTGPSLVITLLLTTGSRHPFTIDGKYLRKRSVNVENYDPFAMSVYTLKELIWREWRSGK